MLILPLMGVVDTYLEHHFDEESREKKLSSVIVTVSTMLGMWCFKCLLPLMSSSNTGAMEHFLLFQQLVGASHEVF